MNGLQLKQFGDFAQTWKLVTVRYRQDTQEMRFTYANPLAYQTLKQNHQAMSTDPQRAMIPYPDGSMFAKIGFLTGEDPSFPNSSAPQDQKRFQFMVRDKKRYADTGGWGYALFTPEGELFPDEAATQTQACVACHNLVPERQFVFSQLVSFSPGSRLTKKAPNKTQHQASTEPKSRRYQFVTQTISQLKATWPHDRFSLIPSQTKSLRQFRGDPEAAAFRGSIDEIRPLLIQESLSTQQPAYFISRDGQILSLVAPAPNTLTPEANCSNGRSITTKTLLLNHYCMPAPK
ncbi:MAG TPA: cytochrome P460 family protein [Pseudobdellovibrionaceae bacterium]|nr:cytochrome P460 family protein [Pseudobdellovibrionaceae bacterium]